MNFTSDYNVENFDFYQESAILVLDLFKLVQKYLESKFNAIS
jgi:hypothetical protein